MERFSNQAGTRLSFADATIMGVARSRADGLILSFDEEFRKVAGLVSTLNKLTGGPRGGGGEPNICIFLRRGGHYITRWPKNA